MCNRCRSGQCFALDAKCDFIKDCEDGSDEEDCEVCEGIMCCDGTCLPSYFLNDGEIDCSECRASEEMLVHDESSSSLEFFQRNETCAFICNRHQCVHPSKLNDGILDCKGLEGHLDETIGKLERSSSCFDILGSPIFAPRCVYLKDKYGAILGCRDLSHLQNCSDFPCQEGYYKCPDSYCIPVHYVLNGRNDFPAAEEEKQIVNYTCVGNFACWNSTVCLHPDLVCDRHTDCLHNDDELNCDVSCTTGFRYMAGTVTIENATILNQVDFKFISINTQYIDLSGLDIKRVSKGQHFFEKCIRYLDITLSRCSIQDNEIRIPSPDRCGINIYRMDLSYNQITFVDRFCIHIFARENIKNLNLSFNTYLQDFSNTECYSLEILDLSHTGLSYLHEKSFSGLHSLRHLNLSHSKLSNFHRDIFVSGFTLQNLDLRYSPIVKFYENTYNGLIITSSLYADNFGLCCPQIRGNGVLGDMCHSSEDAISSCYDLIGVEVQRILLWLMAGIALVGNLVVILYRLMWNRCVLKKAYGLFVLNLGMSDIIMGIYLLLIAGADICYRGVYILYDKDWKESVVCKVANFLSTFSKETSSLFTFIITVDRFLALKFLYRGKKFSKLTKITALALAWGTGFMLALIPVLPIFGNSSVFTFSSMCISLPLINQRVNGWEYLISGFIILNCMMFLFIALGQLCIFKSISENKISKETKNQASLRRVQDIHVAKQLSLVVSSELFCWFPVGFMGLLSLSGHEMSNDIYAWTIVLVLPVNSAVNPVLYIIPILKAKWEQFKQGKSNLTKYSSSSRKEVSTCAHLN